MKKFFTTMFALVAIAGTAFTVKADDDAYFKCLVDGTEVKNGDRIDLSKYYEEKSVEILGVNTVYARQYNTHLAVIPSVAATMSVTVDYVGNKTPLDEDGLYGAELTVQFCGFTGECTSIVSGDTYTREGETTADKEIDMETELVVTGIGSAADGDLSKLAIDAEFNMTLTVEDQSVVLTFYIDQEGLSAGVNDIEADNDATAIYYDLQGRCIDNPSNGLYIVKKGSKVSKQFIR